jgi:hypothetical protein
VLASDPPDEAAMSPAVPVRRSSDDAVCGAHAPLLSPVAPPAANPARPNDEGAEVDPADAGVPMLPALPVESARLRAVLPPELVGAPIASFNSFTRPSTRSWNAPLSPVIRLATMSSRTVPSRLLAPRVAVAVAAAALMSVPEPLSSTPTPTAAASAGHGWSRTICITFVFCSSCCSVSESRSRVSSMSRLTSAVVSAIPCPP